MKPQNARPKNAKEKLEPKLESVIQVKLPLVRSVKRIKGTSGCLGVANVGAIVNPETDSTTPVTETLLVS